MTALGFEEGQESTVSFRVTEADVESFARLSGDVAPIHLDSEFARRHGFASKVVHGAMLAAGVSKLVGLEMPGSLGILERMDISFRAPVYAPADLTITGRVRQISESVRSIILDIKICDSAGSPVATGKTWHRILDNAANEGG